MGSRQFRRSFDGLRSRCIALACALFLTACFTPASTTVKDTLATITERIKSAELVDFDTGGTKTVPAREAFAALDFPPAFPTELLPETNPVPSVTAGRSASQQLSNLILVYESEPRGKFFVRSDQGAAKNIGSTKSPGPDSILPIGPASDTISIEGIEVPFLIVTQQEAGMPSTIFMAEWRQRDVAYQLQVVWYERSDSAQIFDEKKRSSFVIVRSIIRFANKSPTR